MLFLYEKSIGCVKRGDNQVLVTWLTGRWRDQTIPSGGVRIVGRLPVAPGHRPGCDVDPDIEPEFFTHAEQEAWGKEERTPLLSAIIDFTTQFLIADVKRRQREEDPEVEVHLDPLNFLAPTLLETGGKVFVLAFRESEAAQAAYDAGFRATGIVGGRPGVDWDWAALGKV